MSEYTNRRLALNATTAALLRNLAARFREAGRNHPQWKHCYARVVGEATEQCSYPPGWEPFRPLGVPWSQPCTIFLDDRGLERSMSLMGGPGARHGAGWEGFEELAFEVWGLLPQLFSCERHEHELATEPWLAIVYDRLAETSLVKKEQPQDENGTLWEIRALTVSFFEASAKAIELILAECGVMASAPPASTTDPHRPTRKAYDPGASDKVLPALLCHHQYDQGCIGNKEPITGAELARLAGVSPKVVSKWFKGHFGSQKHYAAACRRNPESVQAKLKESNGDYCDHITSEADGGTLADDERDRRDGWDGSFDE